MVSSTGALLVLVAVVKVNSFIVLPHSDITTFPSHGRRSCTMLAAKSPKKKGAAPPKSGNGFGAAKIKGVAEKVVIDAPTALRLSETAYDQYEQQAADDIDAFQFRQYVVATRASPDWLASSKIATSSLHDWVPIAQLGLLSSADQNLCSVEPVTHAVAGLAREVATAAASAVPSLLAGVPRVALQYSIEPQDSFLKYVYDTVVEEKKDEGNIIPKYEAWDILGIEKGSSVRDIKMAYLKLARDHHPDTLIGSGLSEEEMGAKEKAFIKISKAYEILGSGQEVGSSSWYESIGGKGRTGFTVLDFNGQQLGSERVGASMDLSVGGWRAAVRQLDSQMVQTFAARNAAKSRQIPIGHVDHRSQR